MKILNTNQSGQDFYSSQEASCADCCTDLDETSSAYIYMRKGEPVFYCQDCHDLGNEENLEKSFISEFYSI